MTSDFDERNRSMVEQMAGDPELRAATHDWHMRAAGYEYPYHFTWLGVPIIQFPQDIVALQEIIWSVQPDLIVETGIARGGSIVFHASMLELLGGPGDVIGIDIDIREHARTAIASHRLAHRITTIEGSSTDPSTVEAVRSFIDTRQKRRVMVLLDSNHTADHVLAELRAYGPMVTKGSYLVVLDTNVEEMPDELVQARPWGRGNSPKTAVDRYLEDEKRFVVDDGITQRLLITVAPGGYLRCVSD